MILEEAAFGAVSGAELNEQDKDPGPRLPEFAFGSAIGYLVTIVISVNISASVSSSVTWC